MLGGFRERLGSVGEDEKRFVLVGVEADVGARHIVGDDQVAALFLQLETGVGLKVFSFGSEADEESGEANGAASGTKDVLGSDEVEGEVGSGFLNFLHRGFGRSVVGDRCGEERSIHLREVVSDRLIHLLSRLDRNKIHPIRHIQRCRAGDEEHSVASMGSGVGDLVAHLSGRAVRQVADGIDGLAGRAGGDQDFHNAEGRYSAPLPEFSRSSSFFAPANYSLVRFFSSSARKAARKCKNPKESDSD